VDTGDRVEGNGLYDASTPKGKFTLGILAEQNINVICSGNHELYKTNTSAREYYETVPDFQGNYIASNLDFIDPKTGEQRPLAPRSKKFTTKNQGIRILAFGFLFDFTGNGNNTVVKKVSDTIKEPWFQDAVHDREVDLFLVAGHIPLRSSEFTLIYRAIRQQQWDVPIQLFGGHTHIRDYVKYDSKAYALESGRYMETIGFQSISGLSTGGKSSFLSSILKPRALTTSPTFSRRYIDNNLYSLHSHTALNVSTFPTPHGRNVSTMISHARSTLKLDHTYGCAPQTLWTNRAPFPSNTSIFTWLQDEVLPDTIHTLSADDEPSMVLTNTGALRFDIFEGRFTTDTMYSVSPFTSGFRHIKAVPYAVASRLLMILNQEVPQLWQGDEPLAYKSPGRITDNVSPSDAQNEDRAPVSVSRARGQIPLGITNEDLTPGYTTHDDAGNDGDDTLHSPINFYKVPNCIESRVGFPSSPADDPDIVDLIYVDFIEKYILLALKFLGTDYEQEDTEIYMQGKTLTAVVGDWVAEHWGCEGGLREL